MPGSREPHFENHRFTRAVLTTNETRRITINTFTGWVSVMNTLYSALVAPWYIGYTLHNGRSAPPHRAFQRSHRNEVNKHSIGEDASAQIDGCGYMCCLRWLTVRGSYALSETALVFGNWQFHWLVFWYKGSVTGRWVGRSVAGAILNWTELNWTELNCSNAGVTANTEMGGAGSPFNWTAYTYTYIYIYICTYVHTYVHINIHTYIHIYIYIYKYSYTYVHIYYTDIYTYVQSSIHTYVYTYIYMYIHTYIHMYIHIYSYIGTYIHT
jgi:hypothetical protein